MAASLRSLPRKWLLSFNDPRCAFLQALIFYFTVCSVGGSPFRLSVAPYFQFLADAFLHGQLHLRLLPPTVHDLVQYHGLLYLYWPPFPAVVLMPLVVLFGVNVSDVLLTVFIGALNVGNVALLLNAAHQRGIIQLSNIKRAWLVIFFAFGTVHITLATNGNVWFLAQVIGFAAVIIAYWGAIALEGWKAYLVAGLGMAAAIATRNHLIFAGIWPAWYLLSKNWKVNRDSLLKNMIIGILPILVTGSLLALYNFVRFGNPMDVGITYHNMSSFFRADYDRYGAFNLHYVPINFYYQYIFFPFPLSEKTTMGGSLFLLSPLFLAIFWAIWKGRRSLSTWALVISILLVDIPILLLMGTGWVQFGPRYTLDFTVPMLLLTALGISKLPDWVIGSLVLISMLFYIFGAFLML